MSVIPITSEPLQEQAAQLALVQESERERERQRERQRQQQEREVDLERGMNARWPRCDECPACQAHARHAWGVSRAALPCESWLSRKKYTSNERAELYKVLCDRRPQHTYGFASQEDLHQYIQQSV